MKNYLYCMYNKLSARYESVMTFASDGMALHRLSRTVDTTEYELCRIGSINIEDGNIESCPPVRLVWETPDTKTPTVEAK